MAETILIRAFEALDTRILYAILKLRFDVFILEQESFYPELDNQDQTALHLTAHRGADLVGVLRILPTDPVSIGRVAVARDARSGGLASRMMQATLAHIEADWPDRRIKLGAQQHLEAFYARFDFTRCSDIYYDGGIPHVDMVRDPNRTARMV